MTYYVIFNNYAASQTIEQKKDKDDTMIKQTFFALTFMIFAIFSYTAHAQGKGMVVEWAPFEVREGVSNEQLLQASEHLQNEFLVKQKGYIKRELLKGEGRQWVDLIYWASEEDAQAAIQNAMNSAACGVFFGLMKGVPDPEELIDPAEGVFHYKRMAGWE